jgi:ribonuclease HII
VVGAASIVAKVERDRAVDELREETGLDLGSGYPSDPKTLQVLPELLAGETPHDCLRWRWKTISNAWQELKGAEVPVRTTVQGEDMAGFGQSNLSEY